MEKMLFKDQNGVPLAQWPFVMVDGVKREQTPDGVQYFDLPGAVKRFGFREPVLRELWESTFVGYVELEAMRGAGEVEAVPADGGAEAGPGREVKTDAVVGGGVGGGSGEPPVSRDVLLREYLCGHLSEGEFAEFMEVCRERQINPWLRKVIPEVKRNDDGDRQLVFITTIEFLRDVAKRDPDFVTVIGPEWCGRDGKWLDVWTDDGPPLACRAGVIKRGVPDPVWGVVRWDEVSKDDSGQIPAHYLRMPTHMIGIRAEAHAMRRACASAARLYLKDESAVIKPRSAADARRAHVMAGADRADGRGRAAVGAAAADVDVVPAGGAFEDEEEVTSDKQFQLALLDLGLRDPQRRADVIAAFRREFGYRMEPAQFYRRVLDAVRMNPKLYGIDGPDPANN